MSPFRASWPIGPAVLARLEYNLAGRLFLLLDGRSEVTDSGGGCRER